MVSFQVHERSVVARPAEVVWNMVTTLEGINAELRPLMAMTTPPNWTDDSLAELTTPIRLGKSWIFAFGVVPVDFDDLQIVELTEMRFKEHSTMLSASRWVHERTVTAQSPTTAIVEDIVSVTPRTAITVVPFGLLVHKWVISMVFRHRHRRLRKLYGNST